VGRIANQNAVNETDVFLVIEALVQVFPKLIGFCGASELRGFSIANYTVSRLRSILRLLSSRDIARQASKPAAWKRTIGFD
jgi:hypothetical protein